MRQFHAQNAVRAALLTRIVFHGARASAAALWAREKALWVQKQLKTLADPRKSRDLKAFSAKFPPGAQLVPDEEDCAKIRAYELGDAQATALAWAVLLRMRQQHQCVLEANFAENSLPGALFCRVFNFIPSGDFLEQAFTIVRRGDDVAEWVSAQDVPSEFVPEAPAVKP